MNALNRQTVTAIASAGVLALLVIALAVWAAYNFGLTDDFARLMRSALGQPLPTRYLMK